VAEIQFIWLRVGVTRPPQLAAIGRRNDTGIVWNFASFPKTACGVSRGASGANRHFPFTSKH